MSCVPGVHAALQVDGAAAADAPTQLGRCPCSLACVPAVHVPVPVDGAAAAGAPTQPGTNARASRAAVMSRVVTLVPTQPVMRLVSRRQTNARCRSLIRSDCPVGRRFLGSGPTHTVR